MGGSERSVSQIYGLRAAIIAPLLVAVLSLATGLTNIAVGVTFGGPLAPYIPEVAQAAAGFTGALTGFLMLLSTWSLRHRHRVGWYATMLLLPITAVQGLIQATSYSLPLVVLSILSMPVLGANYRQFDQRAALSNTQIAALIALSGTLGYGTVGTYALREEFGQVETVLDAFYYTVVTASTVGYGDVTPASQQARVFSLSVVVLGTASFAVALGSVLGPAIEARFAHALGTMTETEYDLLENHIVILGYGDLTEPLIEELGTEEFVIVTDDTDRVARYRNRDINVISGNPSDEQPLHDANIEQARAVIVATENDAEDAFAILTARELSPNTRIIAAATARENIQKLRRAGADTVLSPAMIGGQLLGQSALRDDGGAELIEQFE
ncbi:potassium channel protein [Halovenus sp. WSH3]|uniref:Potassium channel protein n=1 Tax=Halovenus carboxidivorans TaxID=2692199 RepID=A0A6B0T532_9EURY|nr:NAD-binding protein [Halovenus carboxidivorans]MXR50653.1 potassium channel protein [Halovenus carboxidivorans]